MCFWTLQTFFPIASSLFFVYVVCLGILGFYNSTLHHPTTVFTENGDNQFVHKLNIK